MFTAITGIKLRLSIKCAGLFVVMPTILLILSSIVLADGVTYKKQEFIAPDTIDTAYIEIVQPADDKSYIPGTIITLVAKTSMNVESVTFETNGGMTYPWEGYSHTVTATQIGEEERAE